MVNRKTQTPETLWLEGQEVGVKNRFLTRFVGSSDVHLLDGIIFPISNLRAREILEKCSTDSRFLKRILARKGTKLQSGKTISAAIKKTDDCLIYFPDGKFGPQFFEKKTAIRMLNAATIYEMTSRSRRSNKRISKIIADDKTKNPEQKKNLIQEGLSDLLQ